MNEESSDFQSVRARLDEIADAVSDENLPLDDALSLYEEAIKLGMTACDLSETSPASEEEGAAVDESDTPEEDIYTDVEVSVYGAEESSALDEPVADGVQE